MTMRPDAKDGKRTDLVRLDDNDWQRDEKEARVWTEPFDRVAQRCKKQSFASQLAGMLHDALCVIVHNPFYRAAQCCSQFPVLRRQESFLKFYPPLDRSSLGYEQTEPFTAITSCFIIGT